MTAPQCAHSQCSPYVATLACEDCKQWICSQHAVGKCCPDCHEVNRLLNNTVDQARSSVCCCGTCTALTFGLLFCCSIWGRHRLQKVVQKYQKAIDAYKPVMKQHPSNRPKVSEYLKEIKFTRQATLNFGCLFCLSCWPLHDDDGEHDALVHDEV